MPGKIVGRKPVKEQVTTERMQLIDPASEQFFEQETAFIQKTSALFRRAIQSDMSLKGVNVENVRVLPDGAKTVNGFSGRRAVFRNIAT